jgi:hypothetical protein
MEGFSDALTEFTCPSEGVFCVCSPLSPLGYECLTERGQQNAFLLAMLWRIQQQLQYCQCSMAMGNGFCTR